MKRVLLNNVDHADLRVAPRTGAEFGDRANQLPIYPAEFEQAQRDFPILFRRDGESIDAVVLLGLDSDENLFLDEQGWTSRYVPAMQRRGPFSIALARDGASGEAGEPMVHVDLDDPRVGDHAGLPLFLPHGGDAPYLQHVSAALRTIYEGAQQARAINAQLAAAGLLREVVLEIDLGDEGGYNVPGVLAVDEGALAALPDAELARLHRAGLLRLATMAVASLANVSRLIELKNKRRAAA
ncbi:SapC family protein [Sphingomonas yunnanensis]|uniref:SapC family protein n=1 Tax=Sphingomonas yunnanensis TaxID=310400 RepID=UPI001CA74263|nr:SapC family protein [Sphingomonas yunnanensis]MBY9061326.1 SapC family protein [Sphingomonas yunnanensis]